MSSVKWAVTTVAPAVIATATACFPLDFRGVSSLRVPTRWTSEGIIMAIREVAVAEPTVLDPSLDVVFTVSLSPMEVSTLVPVVCVRRLATPWADILTEITLGNFSTSLI